MAAQHSRRRLGRSSTVILEEVRAIAKERWADRKLREINARQRKEAEDYVGPQLQPDEKIAAVLVRARTMPPYPIIGLFTAALTRVYSVVVTDRRVLFVRHGLAKGEPQSVEQEFTRDDVHVVEWQPKTSRITATGVAILVLDRGGEPMKLRPDAHTGAEELVEALGGVATHAAA